MRRRYRLAITAVAAVGGAIAWRWAQKPSPSPSPPSSARQPVSLGPVPLALPDEPSAPAQLTGRIQSLEPESELGDSPCPAVVPPNLPSNATIDVPSWRPSARTEDARSISEEKSGDSLAHASDFQNHTQIATYRTPGAALNSPALPSIKQGGPSPRAFKTVVHRIADGDTLASLAARYLGSASRWPEIFAANRDRLSNPEILPIKTELRIVVPASAQDPAGRP